MVGMTTRLVLNTRQEANMKRAESGGAERNFQQANANPASNPALTTNAPGCVSHNERIDSLPV